MNMAAAELAMFENSAGAWCGVWDRKIGRVIDKLAANRKFPKS